MRRLIVAIILLLMNVVAAAQSEKLTASDIVARSLSAIGTPEARAQLQYYELNGEASMHTSIRSISAKGTALLTSEKNQVKFATKFESTAYSGDQFVYDGKKAMVSQDTRGMRTPVGDFLSAQTRVLSDGLMGGILSTAWPLYDPKLRGAKLQYDGVKKVKGEQLYQ